MTLARLAFLLDGVVIGRTVHAPAPGLPRSDRSLIIGLSWGAPSGFLIISRSVPRDVARAHVLERCRIEHQGRLDFEGAA